MRCERCGSANLRFFQQRKDQHHRPVAVWLYRHGISRWAIQCRSCQSKFEVYAGTMRAVFQMGMSVIMSRELIHVDGDEFVPRDRYARHLDMARRGRPWLREFEGLGGYEKLGVFIYDRKRRYAEPYGSKGSRRRDKRLARVYRQVCAASIITEPEVQ